jgi:hypothetical protein
VCGLPAGLSRAAPRTAAGWSGVGAPAFGAHRQTPTATPPRELVTVLFQPGCLAAAKIHGLLESTPLRSGRGLRAGSHDTVKVFLGEEILDSCSYSSGHHLGLGPRVRLLDIYDGRPFRHDRAHDDGRQP